MTSSRTSAHLAVFVYAAVIVMYGYLLANTVADENVINVGYFALAGFVFGAAACGVMHVIVHFIGLNRR